MASTDEQVIFEVIVRNDDALKRIRENKEAITDHNIHPRGGCCYLKIIGD